MRAHARARSRSACRACGEHIQARRSTRRIAPALAVSAPIGPAGDHPRPYRPSAPHPRPRGALDPRPAWRPSKAGRSSGFRSLRPRRSSSRTNGLAQCRRPRACYGLRTPEGELVGVVAFAAGPAPESGDMCGREHRDRAVCLARGAWVHWAHPHAASFLISRACKLAAASSAGDFLRLCRSAAGEVGTVYQAANGSISASASDGETEDGRWRFFNRREGQWRSRPDAAQLQAQGAALRAHPEWIAEWTPDKGRYVWFEGDRREKRALKRALKYAPQAYPKRTRGPMIRRSPVKGLASGRRSLTGRCGVPDSTHHRKKTTPPLRTKATGQYQRRRLGRRRPNKRHRQAPEERSRHGGG